MPMRVVSLYIRTEGELMPSQECRELVRQYVPEIMKAVISLPEEQVCGAIGLCSASSLHGGEKCTQRTLLLSCHLICQAVTKWQNVTQRHLKFGLMSRYLLPPRRCAFLSSASCSSQSSAQKMFSCLCCCHKVSCCRLATCI